MHATEKLPEELATITVPLPTQAPIEPLAPLQASSDYAQFVATNASVKDIKAVISQYFGTDGGIFQVYYFRGIKHSFFVKFTAKFVRVMVSDFVSMFAEKRPEIVITAVDEKLVTTDPSEFDRTRRQRLTMIEKSRGEEVHVVKNLFIDRGVPERIAS